MKNIYHDTVRILWKNFNQFYCLSLTFFIFAYFLISNGVFLLKNIFTIKKTFLLILESHQSSKLPSSISLQFETVTSTPRVKIQINKSNTYSE